MKIRLQVRGEVPGQGFSVTMFVENNKQVETITGYLPSLPPTLQVQVDQWRNGYLALDNIALRMTPRPVVEKMTIEQLRACTRQLGQAVNDWLDSGGKEWQRIRDHLTICSNQSHSKRQAVELFLEIEDDRLVRLPWQEWQFLDERFPETEIIFSNHRNDPLKVSQSGRVVSILVVVGNTAGIEQGVQADISAIKKLEARGATVEILPQPTTQQALMDALWEKSYDIFVFTGHSGSDERGRIGWIELSAQSQVHIDDLKGALQQATKKGLQICIFNSCDGLGLAKHLAKLKLPITIIMREPVPDEVAVRFLKILLEKYSEGRSLFSAFWEARQRTRDEFNSKYPGIGWLPKIFMSKATTPPSWKQLGGKRKQPVGLNKTLVAVVGIGVVGLLGGLMIKQFVDKSSISQPPISIVQSNTQSLESLISRGERSLLSKQPSGRYGELKKDAIEAFQTSNYQTARDKFKELRDLAKSMREANRNDSEAIAALKDFETLIYLNNAEARLRSQSGGSPIRTIGVTVPVNQDPGKHILFGVAQAQTKAINNGVNLVIVIADDNNKVEQAQNVAKLLVQQDVLAVVGHYTSDNTCGALPIYSDKFIPLISSTSTVFNIGGTDQNNKLVCGDTNNVFFRTASNTDREAESLARYLTERREPSLNVITFYKSGERYSEDLRKRFKAKFSESVIKQEIELNKPDQVDRFLKQSLDQNVVLAVFPDGRTNADDRAFNNAIDVIRKAGGKHLILGANTLVLSEALSDITKGIPELDKNKILNQLVLAVDWNSEAGANGEFINTANTEWAGEVNQRTAKSYEAVQALVEVFKALGNSLNNQQSIEQQRNQVLSSLRTIRVDKSDVVNEGGIQFNNEGNRSGNTSLIWVRGMMGSNNQPRFAPFSENK